jgi:hypothetical protein
MSGEMAKLRTNSCAIPQVDKEAIATAKSCQKAVDN